VSEAPAPQEQPGPAARRRSGPRWARNKEAHQGFSPHYLRYVPGLGLLHVLPDDSRPGAGFTWRLQAGRRRLNPAETRSFADPDDAMAAANRAVSEMRQGLFADLTLPEAQELFRRLARARALRGPTEEDGGPAELETVRRDLHWHLEVLDLDPDAGPHTPAAAFTEAALTAGQGAWLASLNDAAARRHPGPAAPPRRRTARPPGRARPGQAASPGTAP
jgi:hypothetical protein